MAIPPLIAPLSNSYITLTPFSPQIHTPSFVHQSNLHPALYTYIDQISFDTPDEFNTNVYDRFFKDDPTKSMFAVLDLQPPSPFPDGSLTNDGQVLAGILSVERNEKDATAELGVIVFPEFHGTHVTRNAVGLVLLWLMDPPSMAGLGLRRVEWKTHAGNQASRQAAARMGFELEGVARWARVCDQLLGRDKGNSVKMLEERNGTKGELPGRHTATYSIVWDEWDGKREVVVARMQKYGGA